MTLDSWCGLSTAAHDKTAMSIFDSFKKLAMKRVTDNHYNTKKSTSSSASSEGSKTPTQVCWDSLILVFEYETTIVCDQKQGGVAR